MPAKPAGIFFEKILPLPTSGGRYPNYYLIYIYTIANNYQSLILFLLGLALVMGKANKTNNIDNV